MPTPTIAPPVALILVQLSVTPVPTVTLDVLSMSLQLVDEDVVPEPTVTVTVPRTLGVALGAVVLYLRVAVYVPAAA